jgi:hypothetical protein
MNSNLRSLILVGMGIQAVWLGTLVMCYVDGVISIRAFVWWIAGGSFLGWFVLWRLMARARRSRTESVVAVAPKRLRSRIIFLKLWVGLLVLCLFFGLTQIREAPIISTVVGILVNQMLLWAAILRIKRLQTQLRST